MPEYKDGIQEAYEKINEMRDDENPEFLFAITNTKLVLDIALKKMDVIKIAKEEMIKRGFDKRGKWIGFEEAKKIWK